MHAKLFSLHTALANETAGERGIYLESEGFIVITQRGKPQLFKCYPLSPLKLIVIIKVNHLLAETTATSVTCLNENNSMFELTESEPNAFRNNNLTFRSKNAKSCYCVRKSLRKKSG